MKKVDYEKLDEIVVKNQKELDMIPLDFRGRIYIEFGETWNRAVVSHKYYNYVVAWGNSSVEARGNSSVEAWGNSSVEARGNSSVEARGNSSVEAWENSSVEAWGNSSVEARGNSSVEARGNSSVEAWENSSVEARGNSSVEAWENSSVVARGNSSVVAWGNSSVVAWENSSVVAWGNSSVESSGNAQIVDTTDNNFNAPKIQISGNSRIVHNPKNIHEYLDFYGIKHTKTTAILYKAVRKQNGKLVSDYNRNFEYEVGKVKKEVCDTDEHLPCSNGIHISYLNYALEFGKSWDDLTIIEVRTKIKDIVFPINCDGKVRTKEVKVLREVPLSECGAFGKILEKRRNNDNK